MTTNPNYCPNCNSYTLINIQSGEIVRLGCKKYSCEYCGKIKALKLKKALNKYLSKFKIVRMFTYTVRTTIFKSPKHWNALASEVWRRYINNIRRNPNLTKKQQNFQFIKIVEFTQRGFIHFHVIQTEYIDWFACYRAWNEALAVVLARNLVWSDNKIINGDQLGAVNIKGIQNYKHAANYVVKYLVKSAKEITENTEKYIEIDRKRVRLWSKSEKISFFPKKQNVHGWRFTIMAKEDLDSLLNLYLLDVTSPELSEKIIKSNDLEPKLE